MLALPYYGTITLVQLVQSTLVSLVCVSFCTSDTKKMVKYSSVTKQNAEPLQQFI